MVSEIRGFASPAEHDESIAAGWRARVGKNDTVYVLGDVAVSGFGSALAFIDALPGTKHLISGNHDPVHPMHRTYSRMLPRFLEVFKTVGPFLRRKVDGREFMLSHFPYLEWGDGTERPARPKYDQYRLADVGTPLLHGHTHGKERVHGHSLHVGVDAWDMDPVRESVVLAFVDSLNAGSDK